MEAVHCRRCLKELSEKSIPLSPRQYAKVEFGITEQGVQLRCLRHDINIIQIDFGGQKLRASTAE